MKTNILKKSLALGLMAFLAIPYLTFAMALPEGSPVPETPSFGPENTFTLCHDGIDNDGDESIDLSDPDCAAFVAPIMPVMPDIIPEGYSTPEVEVDVNVINDNGGSLTAGDIIVKVAATDPTPANFPGAPTPGTNVTFTAGAYNITTDGALNYVTTYSPECSGNLPSDLFSKDEEGPLKTICTITLDDKTVTSGGGGSGGSGAGGDFGKPACAGTDCGGGSLPTPPPVVTPPPSTGRGQVLGESIDKSVTPPTPPTVEPPKSCTPYLKEFIKYGRKNNPEEVTKLQNFLNSYMSAGLEVTGIYDLKTFNAVKAFQVKETSEVLNPWHLAGFHISFKGTGYVYKTTQRRINNIMCEQLNLPMPQLK